MKNPNFLILDEPTNDLDLITLSTLEQFLLDFQGCLMIVSHDRYFMDKLADELFILTGDGSVKIYNGKYTDYREEEKENKRLEGQQKIKKEQTQSSSTNPEKPKQKPSYKEKFEFETLEKEIEKLEKQKAKLTEELSKPDIKSEDLIKASKEFAEITKLLDEKQMRWLELSELME